MKIISQEAYRNRSTNNQGLFFLSAIHSYSLILQQRGKKKPCWEIHPYLCRNGGRRWKGWRRRSRQRFEVTRASWSRRRWPPTSRSPPPTSPCRNSKKISCEPYDPGGMRPPIPPAPLPWGEILCSIQIFRVTKLAQSPWSLRRMIRSDVLGSWNWEQAFLPVIWLPYIPGGHWRMARRNHVGFGLYI